MHKIKASIAIDCFILPSTEQLPVWRRVPGGYGGTTVLLTSRLALRQNGGQPSETKPF
jgi:hypothetical protein